MKTLQLLLSILAILSSRTLSLSLSSSQLPSSPSSRSLQQDQQQQQQHEFELCVGKALDTLRSDYPSILTKSPDFAIFHNNIVVVDPSGVTLHGLESYKHAFRWVHLLVDLFYCKDQSYLTFRLVYDTTRTNIRVCWNAHLQPRFFSHDLVHIDGISVYDMDKATGLITQHKVEHLLINDIPVETNDGIFHAMANIGGGGGGTCTTPEGIGIPALNVKQPVNTILPFQSFSPWKHSSLFSNTQTTKTTTTLAMSHDTTTTDDFDWESYERKNKSRQKFGLTKLTPKEFLDLEAQVQQMELQERSKYTATTTSTAPNTNSNNKKQNPLSWLSGMVDTCESNYDCVRPELCCDFGFIRKCCSSGSLVGQQQQQPVRVIADQQLPPDDLYGRQREQR